MTRGVASLLARVGYLLAAASLATANLAVAFVVALAYFLPGAVLPIAALAVGTAILTPPLLVLAAVGLGTLTYLVGTTATPDTLAQSFVGVPAIVALLAIAGVAGWVWTTAVWGATLTGLGITTVFAYLGHRYVVAITEAPT
ncbi:MAG: hypothetical protein ABEJ27_06625 [Halodesulfurarchaeum sp.]